MSQNSSIIHSASKVAKYSNNNTVESALGMDRTQDHIEHQKLSRFSFKRNESEIQNRLGKNAIYIENHHKMKNNEPQNA